MPPEIIEEIHRPIGAKHDGGLIGGGFGHHLRRLIPRLMGGLRVFFQQAAVSAVGKQGDVAAKPAILDQPAAPGKLVLQGFQVTGVAVGAAAANNPQLFIIIKQRRQGARLIHQPPQPDAAADRFLEQAGCQIAAAAEYRLPALMMPPVIIERRVDPFWAKHDGGIIGGDFRQILHGLIPRPMDVPLVFMRNAVQASRQQAGQDDAPQTGPRQPRQANRADDRKGDGGPYKGAGDKNRQIEERHGLQRQRQSQRSQQRKADPFPVWPPPPAPQRQNEQDDHRGSLERQVFVAVDVNQNVSNLPEELRHWREGFADVLDIGRKYGKAGGIQRQDDQAGDDEIAEPRPSILRRGGNRR